MIVHFSAERLPPRSSIDRQSDVLQTLCQALFALPVDHQTISFSLFEQLSIGILVCSLMAASFRLHASIQLKLSDISAIFGPSWD
jgi:hypothetical protein